MGDRPAGPTRTQVLCLSELTPIIHLEMPTGDSVDVVRRRFAGATPGKRIALVAGIRGDAPEGIRVAHEVAEFLASQEEALRGTIDVYPCANPLAAHRGTALWPFFDVDLNRQFPGAKEGHPPERVAWALCQDVEGADLVIELRGARPAFREAPQAHVRERDAAAAELAMNANVAVVWCRKPGPAAPGTFAWQFPGSIVLEGGTGNRLTHGVGKDLVDGVLNMFAVFGVVDEGSLPFHWAGLARPLKVADADLLRVRSDRGGLFLPRAEVWAEVEPGQVLGAVVDPVTGLRLCEIESPVSGRLLAVREHPVVFPGSVVARVVRT